MEVKIRSVSPKYVDEITKRCAELTRRTGKKWSQNDYLKCLIESDFHRPLADYKKDQFDQSIEQFGESIGRNTQTLEKYIETTNKLLLILIDHEGGTDYEVNR